MALARDHWTKGSEQIDAIATKDVEPTMLPGPNAVPSDTRVVVNIPSFRMDVFANGSLIKSYKIGIGYQQFSSAAGFAQGRDIIFNPTWTQRMNPGRPNPGEIVQRAARVTRLGQSRFPSVALI